MFRSQFSVFMKQPVAIGPEVKGLKKQDYGEEYLPE
jgi:hypothetical protein